MPADSTAIRYEWYMEPEMQIIRWVWEPEDGRIVSSMTFGSICLESRASVENEWRMFDPFDTGKSEVPWVVAQNIARKEGFNIEVAVHEKKMEQPEGLNPDVPLTWKPNN